jgi:glutamate dehydrogenase (NADP+)
MKIDYEKLIDEYCLFDNEFMRKCLQERPECAELILKIILPQIKGLKITEIKPEYEIDNLISRSVCLDAYVVDENGINLDVVKQIKEVERGRIKEYAARVPGSVYTEGFRGIWTVKCDIALPCATQNELNEEGAQALIKNGVIAVAEGANMPTTYEATLALQKAGVLFAPGKAANAGGVATSALEMSQNSQRLAWTFEEVDQKLKGIMENIFANIDAAAKEYGQEDNYVVGANIAGFLKVADAMLAHGCV